MSSPRCDTYNNVNRFLSRKAFSEFEMRVLFQMSANDSASLIDNPKASMLGLHRALFYNAQEGYLETFRPYCSAWPGMGRAGGPQPGEVAEEPESVARVITGSSSRGPRIAGRALRARRGSQRTASPISPCFASRERLEPSGRPRRTAGLFGLVVALGVSHFGTLSASAQTAAPPPYRWVQVIAKAPFAPRDGAGAFVFAGKMWLAGGWNPNDKKSFPRTCSNDVWESADGATGRLVKPNTFLDASFDPARDWEGRHTAGYVVFRDKMWIIGGDPIQRHYQSDVWNSADGRTWHSLTKTTCRPGRRGSCITRWCFKDKLWVLGGQTLPPFAPHEEIFYRDIWNSSDGIHWTQVMPEGAILVGARHDRRERGVQGPDVDSRRRHL